MINIKEENDLLLVLMKNENIRIFRKISAHLGSWPLVLIHFLGEKMVPKFFGLVGDPESTVASDLSYNYPLYRHCSDFFLLLSSPCT